MAGRGGDRDAGQTDGPAPVLAITEDAAMLVRFERVAAAAGARMDRCAPGDMSWRRAGVVLVDAAVAEDLAQRLSQQPVPRQPHSRQLIVVATDEVTGPQWAACVALGAVRVHPPGAADEELVRLVADCADGPGDGLRTVANRGGGAARWARDSTGTGAIVAVMGACGGAGATSLACAVALAARRSSRATMICDLDPHGVGVEVALGIERADGAGWADITSSRGRLPAEALHRALPALPGGRIPVSVLGYSGGPRDAVPAELLVAVLDAGRRAGDIVIVDVPRYGGAAADAAIASADLTALVTTADVRGCYAAVHAVRTLRELGAATGLVVRGPAPGGVGAVEIAEVTGLPLITAMRPEPGIDRALDAGLPPGRRARGPLGRAAGQLLGHLERR